MFDDDLPNVRCKQPVAEFDGCLQTSRNTTDDGRFLVAWLCFEGYARWIYLIDLYRGEKT